MKQIVCTLAAVHVSSKVKHKCSTAHMCRLRSNEHTNWLSVKLVRAKMLRIAETYDHVVSLLALEFGLHFRKFQYTARYRGPISPNMEFGSYL